jgi:hypothetical protein
MVMHGSGRRISELGRAREWKIGRIENEVYGADRPVLPANSRTEDIVAPAPGSAHATFIGLDAARPLR